MYSLKDILFESLKNYKSFRPYKHDEIEEEIDEYFRNDYTQSKLPKMWKDRDDGRSSIKTAPYEFFDETELRAISNTDVGESVQQTSDGGYIITGMLWHSVLLIKTDSEGNTVPLDD